MAEISANALTIYDLAKRTHGGSVDLGAMINEYATKLTIGSVLPLVEATHKDKDVGSFIEPWEYNKHTQLTSLDEGPTPTKHSSYGRTDAMSYRDAAIEMAKKHADYGGAEMMSLMTQEATLKTRDMALDNEHDIFYGDPRNDEREMLGLYPRFTVLTDRHGVILAGSDAGKISPYKTFSAGGTANGSLSSVFLIVPGPNSVCLVYPKGSLSGGFDYSAGDFRRVKNSEGQIMDMRDDLFSVQNGLSVRNRAAAVRIANVDYSTDSGIEGLVSSLFDAVHSFPQDLRGGIRVYLSGDGIAPLLKYFNKNRYAISAQSAQPEGLGSKIVIAGLGEFYDTDHITCGEDTVS